MGKRKSKFGQGLPVTMKKIMGSITVGLVLIRSAILPYTIRCSRYNN